MKRRTPWPELLAAALILAAVAILAGVLIAKPTDAAPRSIPHIALLVDSSGSMEDRYGDAIREAMSIAEIPTDDGRLCVWAFRGTTSVWPEGWVRLPSRDATEKARTWLESRSAVGDTKVVSALRTVLSSKRTPLYVVLVTDGEFVASVATINSAISAAQVKRKKPAVVSVVGLCTRKATLAKIAERWGGAYRVVPGEPQ